MNDAAAGPPPPPRRDDESWREALARWTREQMLVLRRHPWILHIPITSPPLLPNQLRWMDNGLRALAGTALTEGDKVGVIGMLTSYVMSEARIATEIGQAMAGADSGEAQFPGYPALLGQLLDADQYPALHAAVTAGVFDGSLGYEAEDLDFGLARMLDGVELLLTRRAQSDGTNVPSDWGQH